MVVHSCNPNTWEVEAGGSLSSMPSGTNSNSPITKKEKKNSFPKSYEQELVMWFCSSSLAYHP